MRPPWPCSRMRRTAARAQVKVPRRWVSITASKSASLRFHSTRSRRMPALVHMMSSRPERIDRARHQPVGGLAAAHRDHLGHRLATGAADRLDRGLRSRCINVVDDHARTGACQRLREGQAEPAAAAGDDRPPGRRDRLIPWRLLSAAGVDRRALFDEGARPFARVVRRHHDALALVLELVAFGQRQRRSPRPRSA